jgi:hypothetical protein
MGWALVAECLWANAPAHAIFEWFGWWVLYPFGLFAVVMTVLTVGFAFVRRVSPSIRTTVNAVLAGIEVLVLAAFLWFAAVVFFGPSANCGASSPDVRQQVGRSRQASGGPEFQRGAAAANASRASA